ncbi:flavin-containing monooxygenase 5 [Caerostris extrusa]|uniref:Flavin-containing monooxygenase n=1 Tax=Caerostris extrusa TaxID=172846 RepID=A0AAV4VWM0_CAEEX|nr:flavin-containing monooxygenase 5 [Caerostris extrusa]
MICTGRLSHPYIPTTPSSVNFKGKILHTQSLKTTTEFENLNVLIIGSGNSALDAAVDVSTLAKQVSEPKHVLQIGISEYSKWSMDITKSRTKGLPFDMTLLRRHLHILKHYFNGALNSCLEKYLETKIQHEVYNLKPNHRALDKCPPMNDVIPDKILTGRVYIKGIVKSFGENSVLLMVNRSPQKLMQ